jgi:hypothetical protein
VREALQRGEYDDASLTSWGRLDDPMALAEGLGVLKALNAIQPRLTWEGDIPRRFIHHALFVRTVVGHESLNAMQEGLSRDTGVLRLLGCTVRGRGITTGARKGVLRPSSPGPAVGTWSARGQSQRHPCLHAATPHSHPQSGLMPLQRAG